MAKVITDKEWIDFLSGISPKEGKTTSVTVKTTVTKSFPKDNAVLSISTSQLFELFGNLVMEGFSNYEAIQIIGKVAQGAIRTN